jgi:AbrB family looped-hinge helix DNA binding protein
MKAARDERVTMDAKGRVVLPRSVREAAGLSAGAGLVASVEADGSIRIEKVSARIGQMQHRFAKYAVPGRPASDELIAERRLEAERE